MAKCAYLLTESTYINFAFLIDVDEGWQTFLPFLARVYHKKQTNVGYEKERIEKQKLGCCHIPLKKVWLGDGECAIYLLVLNVELFFFLPPTRGFSAFIE